MRRYLPLLLVLVVFLAACTAGPNSLIDTPNAEGDVAGFWMGLWHGLIAPFTFIVSLFSDSVEVFEVHNTGGWYTFGFLMGASCVLGGGGGGGASWRCRKRRD